MRVAAPERSLSRVSRAVRTNGAPWLGESEHHVLARVMRVNGRDGAAFLDQQIEELVEGIGLRVLVLGPRGQDPVQGQALVVALAAHQHPAPVAANRSVVVVPARQAVADFLLHPRPVLGVLEAGPPPRRSALLWPRGEGA